MALPAGQAQAATITAPGDLNPGDTYYYVFVTSTTTKATSSNRADYDAVVQSAATASTFGGGDLTTINGQAVNWGTLASIKDGTSAADEFNPSAPIYLLDNTRIANRGADLYNSSIASRLKIDENGTLNPNKRVWTGSDTDGAEYQDSDGLKSLGNGYAMAGFTTATNYQWMSAVITESSNSYSLYAFSSELQAPAAVPEPTTATGLIGGLMTMLMGRRRRRTKA
ncbi:PEP-CTERM sorting domain-containing protein [Planctomycetales bacterium ZRK34]|nr:PEP-CTERM sorting domain-containing protein [Planctomycetales bacterium ZRK34]